MSACRPAERRGDYAIGMDGPSRRAASLVRAVAIAALPATEQEACLAPIGLDWPNGDEIAVEVGDCALLAPRFVEEGWFPSEVLEPLERLDVDDTWNGGVEVRLDLAKANFPNSLTSTVSGRD